MRSINKRERINKAKAEAKVEFSAKNITPYGGMGLFRKFIQKLRVEKVLDKVLSADTSECGYSAGEKIMSLVYGLVFPLQLIVRV